MLVLRYSIDDSLHVKLADNALSRDLVPDDYCCLADNINRSVKWMAMEAILTNQYTPAADVVSHRRVMRVVREGTPPRRVEHTGELGSAERVCSTRRQAESELK